MLELVCVGHDSMLLNCGVLHWNVRFEDDIFDPNSGDKSLGLPTDFGLADYVYVSYDPSHSLRLRMINIVTAINLTLISNDHTLPILPRSGTAGGLDTDTLCSTPCLPLRELFTLFHTSIVNAP
jgi:hypothetical protein